jgi:hypothetical protein
MPSRVQASTSMCARRAGLRDQLQPRQLLQQRAWELRAFADQHQHVGVAQAHRQLADALDGVGEDLGVVGLQRAAQCSLRTASW